MEKIEIRQNVSREELEKMGVFSWGVWSKEVSEFPWSYDEKETCYILEGEAAIVSGDGKQETIRKGDLVVFDSGLQCTWKITKPIKKHFKFG
ncbi:MAG: cupin domain-containing protein [Patescibacteria group bacterium]|nr:cupin domain-containing protein [Patescibacteria group bacterium]